IRGVRPWMKRVLGPTGAYYLATFLQIIAYRPPVMTVRTEEQERTGHTWMVIAGNAEWTAGGSMRVSPGAKIDDGELNISIIPSIPKLNMITTMFPKVATGEHVHHPGVAYFPARSVEVHSDPPVDVELDGDLIGMTPATFTVHPHSVHVMTPASSSTAADA
ncbi:MAG TPA: hypothetical protein QGF05_08390, partial [Dehalococcoidia bacterium]|nr:hypothetical protein [Dehalococcoidia bacterium]